MTGAPLSICIFSNLFRPVVSGSATQSEALARQLVRLGHKPFVTTARVRKDRRDQVGAAAHRFVLDYLSREVISRQAIGLHWAALQRRNGTRLLAILGSAADS